VRKQTPSAAKTPVPKAVQEPQPTRPTIKLGASINVLVSKDFHVEVKLNTICPPGSVGYDSFYSPDWPLEREEQSAFLKKNLRFLERLPETPAADALIKALTTSCRKALRERKPDLLGWGVPINSMPKKAASGLEPDWDAAARCEANQSKTALTGTPPLLVYKHKETQIVSDRLLCLAGAGLVPEGYPTKISKDLEAAWERLWRRRPDASLHLTPVAYSGGPSEGWAWLTRTTATPTNSRHDTFGIRARYFKLVLERYPDAQFHSTTLKLGDHRIDEILTAHSGKTLVAIIPPVNATPPVGVQRLVETFDEQKLSTSIAA
jgi:hypothetical protein